MTLRSSSMCISYACVFMQVDYPSRTAVGDCPMDKGTRIRLVEDLCEWLRTIMAQSVSRRIFFHRIDIPNRSRYSYKSIKQIYWFYFLNKSIKVFFFEVTTILFIYEKERKLLVLYRINHQCENWINISNYALIINLLIYSICIIDFRCAPALACKMHRALCSRQHKIRISNTVI